MIDEKKLTQQEFKLLHKVVDLVQFQKRKKLTPELRRDVIETSIQALFKEQGVEVDDKQTQQILNESLPKEMLIISKEINDGIIDRLLADENKQQLEIEKFLKDPRVEKDSSNLLGIICKKAANNILLTSIVEANLLKTKIPAFFKTFLYYYSISNSKLMKKTKLKNLLKILTVINLSLLTPFLIKLTIEPLFFVSKNSFAANLIIGFVLFSSFLIYLHAWWKTKKESKEESILSEELKYDVMKTDLYKGSINHMKLGTYQHNDSSPNNFETRELLKIVSKDKVGATILKNLIDREHTLTVFDIGLIGASFLNFLPEQLKEEEDIFNLMDLY